MQQYLHCLCYKILTLTSEPPTQQLPVEAFKIKVFISGVKTTLFFHSNFI